MAKAQHRTPEYRLALKVLGAKVARGEGWCVEPVCKYRTRYIPPGTRWSVSHDTTGAVILGESHLKCNLSEAAIRGNKMRARKRRRWAL